MAGGRGGREPRATKVPKTSDDLDKELEAFMGAPEPSVSSPAVVEGGELMVRCRRQRRLLR